MVKNCIRFNGSLSGVVCLVFPNGNILARVQPHGKPAAMWVVPAAAVQERFTVTVKG